MFMLEIPDDLDKRLTEVAERLQIPKEDLFVQCLEQALQEREKYFALRARYEDYLQNGGKEMPFEEFEYKLLLEEELP